MYDSSKPWWKSKTVIGGLVALFAVVLKAAGVDLGLEDQQTIATLIFDVTSGAGAVLAIYGRAKASTTLTSKKR